MKINQSLKVVGSTFGMYLNLEMPEGTDVVILCYNEGTGLRPLSLLLPHQMYVKDLERIFKEIPGATEIVAIPAKSSDYITLARNGTLK